jgi:hypothetical protein
MANWINGAINSGYTVVSGSLTGAANAKVACWVEYRVISQSIVNNTSTVRGTLTSKRRKSRSYGLLEQPFGDSRGMFR